MTTSKLQIITGRLRYIQGYLKGVEEVVNMARTHDIETSQLDFSAIIWSLERVIDEIKKED